VVTAKLGVILSGWWCRWSARSTRPEFNAYAATGAELAWRIGASVSVGHIQWLSDGSYLALIFRPGFAVARRARFLYRMAKAARKHLREALRDRTGPTGTGTITGESRVRDVAALWIAEIREGDLAPGTVDTYERTLNNHVIPGLGGLRLREAVVPTVDRFVKAVRARHVTARPPRGPRRTSPR
jgi:hypothetical protein